MPYLDDIQSQHHMIIGYEEAKQYISEDYGTLWYPGSRTANGDTPVYQVVAIGDRLHVDGGHLVRYWAVMDFEHIHIIEILAEKSTDSSFLLLYTQVEGDHG